MGRIAKLLLGATAALGAVGAGHAASAQGAGALRADRDRDAIGRGGHDKGGEAFGRGPEGRPTGACAPSRPKSAGGQGESGPASPDTIYFNARIHTIDEAFSSAQAVAITGEKFTAVGANSVVCRLAGVKTTVVDMHGAIILPGLSDNHLHSVSGGPGIDIATAHSIADVLELIAARAKVTPPGELLLVNRNWDEAQLKEERLPLRRDLDQAAPDHPVVVLRGGHIQILNTRALEKWGISEATVPPTGSLGRYPDGQLNGLLTDAQALVKLPSVSLSFEQRIEQQAEEYDRLHAVGVTSVRHPYGTVEDYELRKEMERRGILTMRVVQLLGVDFRKNPSEIESALDSWHLSPDEGDDLLKVGGIKLFADGSFETAYMTQPYLEPYGKGGRYRGEALVGPEQFTAVVKMLNRRGWRVFTHALGDAAIDEALAAYAAANEEKSITNRRWGLEHALVPRTDQFERMKQLGVYLSVQHHGYLVASKMKRLWGEERAAWASPVRSYLDAGLPVSGGTDAPTFSYSPFSVFAYLVTRETANSGVLGADQRISREEALRLIIRNPPYLGFNEDKIGVIAPGRLADMVVLNWDPMTATLPQLREKSADNRSVLLTIVGGRVVYRNSRPDSKIVGRNH